MSSKTFIVGLTELNAVAGAGSIASNLQDAVKNGDDTFSLINSMSQVAATVTSIVPVLRPINIQTNTLAATTSFSKIMVNWHDNKQVKAGDVLNLVGNLAGFVGTVAFFAVGAGPVALWAGGLGLLASATSTLWNSHQTMRDDFAKPLYDNLWSENPEADYSSFYVAPDGSLADRQTIKNDYGNQVRIVEITPEGTFYTTADFDDVYPGEGAPEPGEGGEDPGDDYQCDEYQ